MVGSFWYFVGQGSGVFWLGFSGLEGVSLRVTRNFQALFFVAIPPAAYSKAYSEGEDSFARIYLANRLILSRHFFLTQPCVAVGRETRLLGILVPKSGNMWKYSEERVVTSNILGKKQGPPESSLERPSSIPGTNKPQNHIYTSLPENQAIRPAKNTT